MQTPSLSSPTRAAIQWIRAHENPRGGIYLDSRRTKSYAEITGYLVPTLIRCGEKDLAARLARWLVNIQEEDGSYADTKGAPQVFDTAQVLRGLLAAMDIEETAEEAASLGAKYLRSKLTDKGRGGFVIDASWLQHCVCDLRCQTCRLDRESPLLKAPPSIHLYALPPMMHAAELFDKKEYSDGVENCIEYYLKCRAALRTQTLTHFLGYELEALIDLGRQETIRDLLDKMQDAQGSDGGIPAYDGASWVCSPGVAQFALCWCKIGNRHAANKALNWLEQHQTRSGGFRGSYGPHAAYFKDREIPWAVKFYLDAILLRVV